MKKQPINLQSLALPSPLYSETLPGEPLIEIVGNRRVLIEHHKGVTAYSCNEIRICVSYGQICICGTNLELMCMTKDQLAVTGRINNILLLRG